MIKELAWYLETNRFSNLVVELDESVRAYEKALNEGSDEAGDLREKARSLFEEHCQRSGLRTEENSYINIDAEFFVGKKVDEKALDDFIKNIVKAHGYQQILWTYMGTTGSFTVITKDEMRRQGLNYEDYLPAEYKKQHPTDRPPYIKPKKDTVNFYMYSDGTVSTVYDREKAKLRFDALKDTSGIQWNKGYDPNRSVIKNGWHGAYDETGSWVKITEKKNAREPGARQYRKAQPIQIAADGDTAILYDPADILLSPAELLYLTESGELYGALEVDRQKTVEEIRTSLKDLGLKHIGVIGSPAPRGKEDAQKAYTEILGDMLAPEYTVRDAGEISTRIEEKGKEEKALKEEKEGVRLERTIGLVRQHGKAQAGIEAALAAGTLTVPLSPRRKEDATALGLTEKEAEEIAAYDAPAGKEEEYSACLANIFAAWAVYEKTGLSKVEMAGRVRGELAGETSGKEDLLTTDIALRDILVPAGTAGSGLYSSGIPGVFAEEKTETVDFYDEPSRTAFVKRMEKAGVLPKGGSIPVLSALETLPKLEEEKKAALNRALTRALGQYKAIAMSTGMPIGEVVQSAIKAVKGELPAAELERRISYELPLREFTANASRENRQERTRPIDDIFSRTLRMREAPAVVIGGVSGTPLSAKGFDRKSLQDLYGYSGTEAEKTEELLHDIKLADDVRPETAAGIVALTEGSLNQAEKKNAAALKKTLYANLDGLLEVSYNVKSAVGKNAYLRSKRYKASGISGEFFEDMTRPEAAYNPDVQSFGTHTVTPVYRSRPGIVPLTRGTPKGVPETITPAYKDSQGDILPYFLTAGQKSAYTQPLLEIRKTPSAAKASDTSPISVVRQGSTAGLAADTGNTSSGLVPFAGETSGARTEPFKPTSRKNGMPEDPELARLRRIEANYEHDKAMLEREKQPALARSESHDVGHAEGIEYETPSRADIRYMTSILEEKVKQKVDKNLT